MGGTRKEAIRILGTIAHRSRFGIHLFAIKTPNAVPILSKVVGGAAALSHWSQFESRDSPAIPHRPYLGIQLFPLKAPNEVPVLSKFFVRLKHCGL
jgi:hypothetical protein